MQSTGFTFIARRDARLLILGTLPGAESLRRAQYYAKKENSFWKIMGVVAGAAPELPYAERLKILKRNHIALWDVCAAAQRVGSLDSNIERATIVPNDFIGFFKKHKQISLIGFNGQPAEKLFRQLVLPHLPPLIAQIPRVILPSTSPAHASMNYQQKLARWRELLEL